MSIPSVRNVSETASFAAIFASFHVGKRHLCIGESLLSAQEVQPRRPHDCLMDLAAFAQALSSAPAALRLRVLPLPFIRFGVGRFIDDPRGLERFMGGLECEGVHELRAEWPLQRACCCGNRHCGWNNCGAGGQRKEASAGRREHWTF